MERVNLALFALLNGPAAPAASVLATARIAAQWLIWLVALGLALGYLRSGRAGRAIVIRTGLAAVLALGINFAIAAVWHHPRPFEMGVGHQLLPHAAETSFPSDHATALFATAFGLMAFGARRPWWMLALGAGIAVAWARVWLGVHWPLDMAGSAVVAGAAALAVRRVAAHQAMARFEQVILGFTDAVLAFVRVAPKPATPPAQGAHPAPRRAAGHEPAD